MRRKLVVSFSCILILALVSITSIAFADLSDGLLAFYPLDGNAIDASGNGNDGQVLEPIPCEDFFGNIAGAMCFNGDSAHTINIGNRIKPSFPFTISAWIKPDTVDGRNFIIANDQSRCPGHYYGASLEIRNGRIGANYGDGGYCAPQSRRNFATDPVMVAGAWQHVAVVFRSHRDILFYRNSIELPVTWVDGSGSSIRYSAANGHIGGIYGAIDDVRVYNRALSSNDITEIFQSGTDRLGNTLQTASAYDFSLEQNTQATGSIHLFNPGNEDQIASLEILNAHSGLDLSFQSQDPITVNSRSLQTIPVVIEATTASTGVYNDILLKISTENGETLYSNIEVTIYTQPQADLSIRSQDIHSTVDTPNNSITLQAVVQNKGLSSASNVAVQFYELDNLLDETILSNMPVGASEIAAITIPMSASSGDHLIQVVIDPRGEIEELEENNNEASQIIPWGTPSPTPGNILVTGNMPTKVYSKHHFTVSGSAVYDVYVDGVRYTNYMVKGGSVQITIKDDSGNEWIYGGIHTDINGNFVKHLQAPSALGTYQLSMTVTDKTYTGTRELVFRVVEEPEMPQSPPDPPTITGSGYWEYTPPGPSSNETWVWIWTRLPVNEPIPQTDLRVFSENIYFSDNNPAPDDETTIYTEILYWADNTDSVAENVPVNFYVTYPGTSKEKIGTAIIPSLSVGSPDFGSRYVYATWKNHNPGIYIVEVEIDPEYAEVNMQNNAATRAIIVGELEINRGMIQGQVKSPWGGVKDIDIKLYDSSMSTLIASTLSDNTGHYYFENVPIGIYQVHIIKPDQYDADAETKQTEVLDQQISVVNFFLSKPESICGDLDHDGDVDGDDRNILRAAFRTKIGDYGYITDADYDGDGDIDYSDYQLWYTCYKDYILK